MKREDPQIEAEAESIYYAAFRLFPDWRPWVPGGNSDMQDYARQMAITARECPWDPDVPVVGGIPDLFPDARPCSTVCLREVYPESRSGRGRWWRPDGDGYTDRIVAAGFYPYAPPTERWHTVEAHDVIRALAEDLHATSGALHRLVTARLRGRS